LNTTGCYRVHRVLPASQSGCQSKIVSIKPHRSVGGRQFDQRSKKYAAAQGKLAASGDLSQDERELVTKTRVIALASAVNWAMGTGEEAAEAAEIAVLALLRQHLLAPSEIESLYEPFESVIPLASLE